MILVTSTHDEQTARFAKEAKRAVGLKKKLIDRILFYQQTGYFVVQ